MRAPALFIAPLLLALVCAGCAHKKVLLLTDYTPGSPRAVEAHKTVDRELAASNVPYALHTVNLDLNARPNAIWREERGNTALVRIKAIQPDLVMIAGDEALKALANRIEGSFQKTVFFDVRSEQPATKLIASGYGAGVVENAAVVEALTIMKSLRPELRGVAILSDRSAAGDAIVGAFTAARNLPLPVVDIRRVNTQSEWMKAVEALQSQAGVALCVASCSGVLSDANDGTGVPAHEVLRMTAAASRLPDFSFTGEYVGAEGVMMAVYVPLKEQAAAAGLMANRILFHFGSIQAAGVQRTGKTSVWVNRDRATALGIKLPANLIELRAETPNPKAPQPQ